MKAARQRGLIAFALVAGLLARTAVSEAKTKPVARKAPRKKPRAAKAKRPTNAAEVQQAVGRMFRSGANHSQRLEQISRLFLGARYQLSPLGEGPSGRDDTDPIVRYDAFDCVTYVEQVMALSWQPDHARATQQLQQVRYRRGAIHYDARKHIMMAQWIPQNVAAGFVIDATARIAGKHTRYAKLELAHASFESAKGRALTIAKKHRPLGHFTLPILPIKQMPQALNKIPHGTILTSIRAAQQHVPYRSSHVGLVVVKNGRRWLRHAHKKSGMVVEQPLKSFVNKSRSYRKWPVVGFNLLSIAAKPPSMLKKPGAAKDAKVAKPTKAKEFDSR